MIRHTAGTKAWLVGVALFSISLVLVGGAGSADGSDVPATLTAKGWWWQAQVGLPVAVPPPPNVKSGQLYIQSAPSDSRGAAFAAVRYALAADRTVQSLTLKAANETGTPVVLLACRTGSRWSPAEAGTWTAAPKVDTTACVNGQKAADGQSWVFPVGTLQLDAVLDVAIVPGLDPATKTQTPFTVIVNEPTNDALTTIAVMPPTVLPAPPTLSSAPGATPGPTPTHHQSSPPLATGLPADKIGQTATAPATQAATQLQPDQAPVATTPSTRDKRLGYVLIVLAAAVCLYAFRRDDTSAPYRGAHADAEGESRGLGRFQRVRTEQPPALT
jgi:hypothetical protein